MSKILLFASHCLHQLIKILAMDNNQRQFDESESEN